MLKIYKRILKSYFNKALNNFIIPVSIRLSTVLFPDIRFIFFFYPFSLVHKHAFLILLLTPDKYIYFLKWAMVSFL